MPGSRRAAHPSVGALRFPLTLAAPPPTHLPVPLHLPFTASPSLAPASRRRRAPGSRPGGAVRQSGTVTLTATDVAAPLARYARRLHAAAGAGHHVASPLGAWLLLALCATASEGGTRQDLGATLGCDPADAADLAAALLASPHRVVPAAAAAWIRPGFMTEVVSRWLAGLPAEVETGPLPGQADLDDWARRHTFGLIERFPLQEHDLWLLAATVLATRVSWERPFDLAPASALGPSSPWLGRLSRVLRTPDGPGHEQFIAATEAAGDVAVHTARARGGLLVTSVAAAPDVRAADVLAVAYDLAVARVTRGTAIGATAAGGMVARRSLFDLPLGEGPLWVITEQAAAGPDERCTAVLPAWSARSDHDLSDPALVRGQAGGDGPVRPGGLRGRRGLGRGGSPVDDRAAPEADPGRRAAVRAPVRGGGGHRRRARAGPAARWGSRSVAWPAGVLRVGDAARGRRGLGARGLSTATATASAATIIPAPTPNARW